MKTLPNTVGDGRNARFLEPSPYADDGGEKIGIDPRKIPVSDLRDLGHPESYPKIIRAMCLDCVNGQPGEVRKCVAVDCPLWPVRMGVNPFHQKSGKNRRPPKLHAPSEPQSGSGSSTRSEQDD